MLRKLKWQIPGEPLAARYNWCQGPVPGRGPAVEKHWYRFTSDLPNSIGQIIWISRGRPGFNSRALRVRFCRQGSIGAGLTLRTGFPPANYITINVPYSTIPAVSAEATGWQYQASSTKLSARRATFIKWLHSQQEYQPLQNQFPLSWLQFVWRKASLMMMMMMMMTTTTTTSQGCTNCPQI